MDISPHVLLDNAFLPAAIDLIKSAERSIYISAFKAEITSKPRGRPLVKLFDALVEKSRLGLDVRFLLNNAGGLKYIPLSNLYVMQEFKKQKINIRSLQGDRICHAKLIIVDGKYAILGSHNLSVRSCHNNFEISLYTHHTETVQRLTAIYTEAFDSAKKV